MTNRSGSKSAPTKNAPTLVEVRCAHEGCEETTVMPFERAAKGTHRCPEHSKRPTPAKGGAPEVTLDTGTTVVLPNPADALPSPKRPARSKKSAPTLATTTAPRETAAQVPSWAKRAAARNRAAEKAAVPEVAPVPEPAADAPVAAARANTGRAPKAPKLAPKNAAPNEAPAAKPGSLRAIGAAWIDSLRSAGHSVSTVTSYSADLEVAYEQLGADTPAASLTERQIAGFNVSKGVMKKANGKPKAQPTILKTRRALRLALVWAEQKKLIGKAPYSAA